MIGTYTIPLTPSSSYFTLNVIDGKEFAVILNHVSRSKVIVITNVFELYVRSITSLFFFQFCWPKVSFMCKRSGSNETLRWIFLIYPLLYLLYTSSIEYLYNDLGRRFSQMSRSKQSHLKCYIKTGTRWLPFQWCLVLTDIKGFLYEMFSY